MCVAGNLIYVYDGSFEGMLCCIFEAFVRKERPVQICAQSALQPSLFEVLPIETQQDKALRVLHGLEEKVSPLAAATVRDLFLSGQQGKALLALDFTRLAFERGRVVTTMLGNEVVAAAAGAVRKLYNEAHMYKGLIRFSDVGQSMVAEIEPKNFVLPLIAPHFCSRFRNETFLIYDKTNHAALIWQQHTAKLVPVDALTLPPPTGEEQVVRRLWKRFYDTIAIEARRNPVCQRTHMPKRYWACLTEMQADLDTLSEAEQTPPLLAPGVGAEPYSALQPQPV
jgi:probable DNA metabolism protein